MSKLENICDSKLRIGGTTESFYSLRNRSSKIEVTMKSCTCVGCLLVIVSFSLLAFLIATLICDNEMELEPDSTSGKENFLEIVGTNHSFLMFHHQEYNL